MDVDALQGCTSDNHIFVLYCTTVESNEDVGFNIEMMLQDGTTFDKQVHQGAERYGYDGMEKNTY